MVFDAIQQVGNKGESRLTEWIRGNTRPWMKTLNKSSTSFANSCGHSEGWWRTFFRKCHAVGVLEQKLCNLAKSNQHYAIMAIYIVTWKGQKVISDDEPVMLLDSEDDVVRHKKNLGNKKNAEHCTKMRCAKGGRIIDRLRELMNDQDILNQRMIICIQEHTQIYLPNTLCSSKILTNSGLKEQSKILFGGISNFQRVKLIYLEI